MGRLPVLKRQGNSLCGGVLFLYHLGNSFLNDLCDIRRFLRHHLFLGFLPLLGFFYLKFQKLYL